MFDVMKRGMIIGEPTGGSTGQPLAFSLPGGVMARVCTKRDMYPDGTEWNAKGIQPAILVKPTLADSQSGRDTVLEAALVHLGAVPTKNKARKGK
jgi:C-terminal processing protease CtpA/Prc